MRRAGVVVLAVIVAIAAALTISILFLDLNSGDVPTMIELLLSSAVISLGVGALFVWISSGRNWNRLTTRLLAAHGIGMIVILVNIVIAAYAMFLSTHDLSLL